MKPTIDYSTNTRQAWVLKSHSVSRLSSFIIKILLNKSSKCKCNLSSKTLTGTHIHINANTQNNCERTQHAMLRDYIKNMHVQKAKGFVCQNVIWICKTVSLTNESWSLSSYPISVILNGPSKQCFLDLHIFEFGWHFDFVVLVHLPLSFWLGSCLNLGDSFIMFCLSISLNASSTAFRSVLMSLICLLMFWIPCNASAVLLSSSLSFQVYCMLSTDSIMRIHLFFTWIPDSCYICKYTDQP